MNGRTFRDDYYDVPEYWKARTLIPDDALNLHEPVAAIAVSGTEIQSSNVDNPRIIISYRSEKLGLWKKLISLKPINSDIGIFIVLAAKHFISQNSRKQLWKLKG